MQQAPYFAMEVTVVGTDLQLLLGSIVPVDEEVFRGQFRIYICLYECIS